MMGALWRRIGLTLPVALAILIQKQLHADSELRGVWQGWSDQGYYLQSARAWAALNLDPVQHHYPGGYSLLAAPFVYLTPSQPFMVPDMLCAVACLVLFLRICRRLAPGLPFGDALAALCFLTATMFNRPARELWAIPWTTTAEAPLLLLCLLMALQFGESRRRRDLAAMGFAAGLGALVRPSDAALILAVSGVYCMAWMIAWQTPGRRWVACVTAGAAGLAAGLVPALLVHLAVHGFSAGDYAAKSAEIGFEWRLIPLRWVTLVIDPRPLFSAGAGMAAVFPWFFFGCAGMGLMVCRGGKGGARHALLAGAICLYSAFYFSYRDLHANGLWHYFNAHYFKWTLPFLAFWAVCLLLALLTRGRRGAALLAVAVTALFFAWRPIFHADRAGIEAAQPEMVAIPGGLSPLHQAVVVQIDTLPRYLYLGRAKLRIGDAHFGNTVDFKLFPVTGGALLMSLRVLPAGDAVLTLDHGGHFASATQVITGHWSLTFGLPCLIGPHRNACHSTSLSNAADQ